MSATATSTVEYSRVLPVLASSVPVAQIPPGDIGGERGTRAGLDGNAVEIPEHNLGVVGAAEVEVELSYLVTDNLASVRDGGSDSEEDVVQTRVATGSTARR